MRSINVLNNTHTCMGIVFSVLLFTSFISCDSVERGKTSVSFQIDSLKIKTDSIFASSYTSTTILKTDTAAYLFLSDPFQRLISVIEMNKNKFLFNIKLQDEGPNATQNLGWIQAIGKDSLITISNDYLYIIDWKGNVVKRNQLNMNNSSYDNFDFTKYKLLQTSNNSIIKKDSLLLFVKVRLQVPPTQSSFYNEPIMGSYNYITDEINGMDVHFPKRYINENSNYDLNSYPVISVNGTDIYYNYPFSDAVFSYKNSSTIKVSKNDDEQLIKPLSNSASNDLLKKATYMDTSPRFKGLLFDEKKELVYQLYNLEKDNFGDNAEFEIIVRNSDFEIVEKGIKPKFNLFPTAFVFDGKVFFRRRDAELKNDYIEFIYFDFEAK